MGAKRGSKDNPEPIPDGWDQELYEALKKAANVEGLRKVSEQAWHRLSLLRLGGIALQITKARSGRDLKLAEELLRVLDRQYEEHELCLTYVDSWEFDNAAVKGYAEDLLRQSSRLPCGTPSKKSVKSFASVRVGPATGELLSLPSKRRNVRISAPSGMMSRPLSTKRMFSSSRALRVLASVSSLVLRERMNLRPPKRTMML